MNNNPVTITSARKTHIITMYDRQRRMQDFYNLPGTMYVALGKTTPWVDPNNAEISDSYPPIPSETATSITELIGMQRIQWKKFARPILAPTSEQKDLNSTVYYKGLYYETTNDLDFALANGFTAVMLMMTSDRDLYFPVDITYRQVGLFTEVNATEIYLSAEQYNNLAQADRGHLTTLENFMPLSRQLDQLEKHFVLLEF